MVMQVVHLAEVCQLVAQYAAKVVDAVLVDVVLQRAAREQSPVQSHIATQQIGSLLVSACKC
jgi:hypothetical protein